MREANAIARTWRACWEDRIVPPFEWVVRYNPDGRLRRSLWHRVTEPQVLYDIASYTLDDAAMLALRLQIVEAVARRAADPEFPWDLWKRAPQIAPAEFTAITNALRSRLSSRTGNLVFMLQLARTDRPAFTTVEMIWVDGDYTMSRYTHHWQNDYVLAKMRAESEASLLLARVIRRAVPPPTITALMERVAP